MRNVSDEGRVVFGAPSRVAFDPRREYLYVADSSNNRIVAMDIPRLSSKARLVPRVLPALPGRRTN
jgi:sugar lactone lactonase YvrE